MSRERMREGIAALRAAGDTETFADWDVDNPDLTMVSADADIVAEVSGEQYVEAKLKAMRAHATQITEDGPFFAGAKAIGDQMWGREHYRLAAGTPFPATGGWAQLYMMYQPHIEDVLAFLHLA